MISPRFAPFPLELRFVVSTGWRYIALRARLLSRPPFCFRWFSCLVVSILPQSISPFRVPFCLPFSLWHVFLTSFLFLRDLLIVVSICVEGISFQPPMVSLSLSSGLKLIRLVYLLLPLVAMPNSPLCPVKMFHRMCALTPASPMSPAFVLSSPDGSLSPVIKRQFVQVFRERLFSAAIPHAHTYRGHSFRREGANWAFQCEVPGELIQVFGDWSSDAYKSYLEFSLPAKLRVAQRVSSSLLFS